MTMTVYRSEDGWRWRLCATNGRIVADGAESYTRKRDCLRAAVRILKSPIYLYA